MCARPAPPRRIQGMRLATSMSSAQQSVSQQGRRATGAAPAWAKKRGVARLQCELRALSSSIQRGSLPGVTEVFLPKADQLDVWRVRVASFEGGGPVAQRLNADLQELRRDHGVGDVLLELRFPKDYPADPPFLWVVRPRMQQYTGHVTSGGSVCIEALTHSGGPGGWQPNYCVESILALVLTNMVESDTRPLAIAHPLSRLVAQGYSLREAQAAFHRVASQHGWTAPPATALPSPFAPLPVNNATATAPPAASAAQLAAGLHTFMPRVGSYPLFLPSHLAAGLAAAEMMASNYNRLTPADRSCFSKAASKLPLHVLLAVAGSPFATVPPAAWLPDALSPASWAVLNHAAARVGVAPAGPPGTVSAIAAIPSPLGFPAPAMAALPAPPRRPRTIDPEALPAHWAKTPETLAGGLQLVRLPLPSADSPAGGSGSAGRQQETSSSLQQGKEAENETEAQVEAEAAAVLSMFRRGGAGAGLEVGSIDRVQNLTLYSEFVRTRAALGQEASDSTFLFHGSSTENVLSICREGFDPARCVCGSFGPGVYLARLPSTSDPFCSCTDAGPFVGADCRAVRPPAPGDGTVFAMLLCEVALGGPEQHHAQPSPSHRGPADVHVVRDTAQAYPAYIVSFKRTHKRPQACRRISGPGYAAQANPSADAGWSPLAFLGRTAVAGFFAIGVAALL